MIWNWCEAICSDFIKSLIFSIEALDMANKINVETQKGIKKMVLQIQELQMQVEEEQRRREEQRWISKHCLNLVQ